MTAGDKIVRQSSETQFGISTLFWIMTSAAILLPLWPITSPGSRIILVVILTTFFLGNWPTKRAIFFILPPMYLPYLWLLWDYQDWPWHGYRWHWISIWLQLPGMAVEIAFHPVGALWFTIITTLATLVAFATFVIIARTSLIALSITSLIVIGLSAVNSCICLALYQA